MHEARFDQRRPAVAGRFYPGDGRAMERAVAAHLRAAPRAETAAAARVVIAPHAGWMFSGDIAGCTYARVVVPDRVIIACPNHTGLGSRRSIWSRGSWALPGGTVPVDEQLADALIQHARLEPDTDAHLHEHAIEVQLPFLLARNPNVRIAPIVLGGSDWPQCEALGKGVARAIAASETEVLLVASTDMSHYVPARVADELDHAALDRVRALDPEGLMRVVRERDISMCGYIPTAVCLVAALEAGATKAELIRYGNSGERSGDYERVVGYAGVVVR